jgi:putative oxygen-independent coproporphyrinogen III oxidase
VQKQPLGAYVHFPWCLKKCPYCDFLSVASEREALPHAAYATAVLGELSRRAAELDPDRYRLETVFFGGGTPSLWEPAELGRVLVGLLEVFGASAADVEVTVECNPTSFDAERARALLAQGVGRVSIGVQALDAARLEFLGRLHDVAGGLAAVRAAIAAGVPRVSADFIFGVAGQSPEHAAAEAQALAELGTTHLSAYALTIEPGTAFGALTKKGRLPLLDEALVADSFVAVERALTAAGFEHYEVSNYARAGHVSRHNLGYWRGHDYLGLGTGAWGTLELDGARLRYRNTPSPERYLAGDWRTAPLAGEGSLIASVERLSPETLLTERILLGLRLADGLDLDAAEAECKSPAWTPRRLRALDKLERTGRVTRQGSRIAIPKAQWLFADGIIAELI